MNKTTKALYPPNWKQLASDLIMERGEVCENCLRPATFKIVLTVHHLDHDPSNNHFSNLKVLCQACHLDQERASIKSFGRVGNRFEAVVAGQLTLPSFEPPRKLIYYSSKLIGTSEAT